ncbi:hypothetical protein KL905_000399 [Ogataea polymorpha]|uniref:Transketolase n=1 Tax=Ogataea polymorpha TaxID=460523 RepID=A0A1B7SID6_9ASCO|nr:uncharacterized protein OGAPODRAFT_16032 [Ogataea polymorpha]KAG7882107.1 hypothetical protein KL937_000678 [Ogataea polymorpha]KAG7891809.1 hypothetical protein KL936_001752 [Ogataea polymorpha]KAG7895162.1 hypothetical protein KL908_001512 [Ogataea polymorpha]KAG7902356.1 hypothetical protein KL935_001264 [Ogataea polymorpha]KAG7911656.1 hypothetical protein KL906_000977 [Ogataea polymorpha]
MSQDIQTKAINTIRVLAADIVAKANSGHPGAPMGMAPAAHAVYTQMKFNPKNPHWINRDRFVLSNGHACALLYTLLHLFGYDLTMDDLKSFRQINSKTPGHPEVGIPGVEVTTGPLGQGISNAVGLAIAQANFAATYNKPGYTLSDNYTYCFFGDGCMMEGVASEAMSLAGHLQLGNLIAFYDDNKISIDGSTEVAFTEDVCGRLEKYGWDIFEVPDADTDVAAISEAIAKAKKTNKPSCIRIRTTIGYGSLNAGSHSVHGAPLKKDDIIQLKEKWGFDPEKSFVVPQEVYDFYHKISEAGAAAEAEWNKLFEAYQKEFPKEGAELARRLRGELPEGWQNVLPTYQPGDAAVASRKLSEVCLGKLQAVLPELVGGSADLTPSNLTRWSGAIDFQPESTGLGNYSGKYLRFGVREHGMGAIINGISAYGANYKSFGATFLNFVSYASGALRLSALSHHPVIWVATHDSIGLGEDGPTHQPIETLAHFRAIPNLMVWRPADGNETSAAYIKAISSTKTPSVLALSRQNLPQLSGSSVEKALKGGYVVHEVDNAKLILVATGSEVSLSIDAAKLLAEKGIPTAVVSIPDFFTFDQQPADYKLSVLPDGVPIMSVEVMATSGWAKYAHAHFGLNRFGASGKTADVYKFFDFTPEGVAKRGEQTFEFFKGKNLISPLQTPF